MRRADFFILSVLFVALFGGAIVSGLYGFGGENYVVIAVIVILVHATVRYRREVRSEGYGVRKLAGPLWNRSFAWEIVLVPVALGLLLGLLEGWDRSWHGLALGLSISTGRLLFELAERMYLRKALNRPGISVER